MAVPFHLSEPIIGGSPARGRKTFVLTLIAALIWMSIVAGATVLIEKHVNSPGPTGEVPSRWPVRSGIPADTHLPTLVMFLHPRCPCTRASLGELEKLMVNCPGRCNVRLVFLRPDGVSDDWTKSALWQTASAIPGVVVLFDQAGAEAHRFHAETSGQTVLYGRDGRLLFQGGITLSRGHSGDNPGRNTIESLLNQELSFNQTSTPVFGCPLFDESCEGGAACKP